MRHGNGAKRSASTTKPPFQVVLMMAEEERFELSIPFWGMLAFQASALDHYATPPRSPGISPVRPELIGSSAR